MKSSIIPFLLICVLSTASAQDSIVRIAFGSCSLQFGKQRIWKNIIDKKPDVWIWLGDAIYADTEDMAKMAAKYAQLDSNANYCTMKQAVPIIATWDDHDYGGNNLGKHYPQKVESQKQFLTCFNEPKDSPRWNREGIYTSYSYGAGDRKVKVILLDTRYHRDDPGPEADMLGEAQWAWLEEEFRNSDAVINIIGSSVQFVNEFKAFENWAKFPASQKKMVDLIVSTGLKGAFMISGDVHYGALAKRSYERMSYPIYDFTSSGLTHGNQITGFKNKYRVPGSRFGFRNFAT
ncbi:MAG: alkaline phosphatase family protein, partial [Flavobacteriales bacterium]|nr:alkaline phosphatase family protein [Flavobacteriales bacterium]